MTTEVKPDVKTEAGVLSQMRQLSKEQLDAMLSFAVLKGNASLVNMLCEAGANPNCEYNQEKVEIIDKIANDAGIIIDANTAMV